MLALHLGRSRCRESLVSALASMGAPGCVSRQCPGRAAATGFELTPPRLLARTTGWSGGDDALVFVDPPASAALEDALLDARIQAGEVRFAFHHRD